MAIVRGAPLVVLYTVSERPYHILIGGPGVNRIEDLKGKKVMVVRPKFLDDLLLQDALKKHGIRSRDVTIFGGGMPQNRLAGLVAGSADAAVLTPPFAFIAQDMGFKAVTAFKDEGLALTAGGVVTRKNVLQSQPEMVRKFMRATLKGHLYIRDNRKGSIPAFAKIMEVELDMAKKIYDFMLPTMTRAGIISTPEIARQAVDFIIKFAGAEKAPPLDKVFDNTLVTELMKELKAKGWKP